MKLVEKVPKDLYKIFGSKYMEFYMQFLVALYEESSQSYSLLGLTERECQMIMNERLAKMALDWSEARVDEEGELITRANMASVSLKHFEDWGWLRRDYDETLNSYVVSFPEYSQLFVELFQKLYSENDGKERESVLTVYSHLYTYSLDKEKNNEILKVRFIHQEHFCRCSRTCRRECEDISMNCQSREVSEESKKYL